MARDSMQSIVSESRVNNALQFLRSDEVGPGPKAEIFALIRDLVQLTRDKQRVASPTKDPAALSELAKFVEMKLENPKGSPTMTVTEVAHAMGKSPGSIRRYVDDGKLSWAGVHGRISTTSVVALLNSTGPRNS